MTPRSSLILALDLGTTAAKVALFDRRGRAVFLARAPLALRRRPGGGVEQDPGEFVRAAKGLLARAGRSLPRGAEIACAGIASQRAAIVVWERDGGRVRGPVVSWMDRRAAPLVARLSRSAGRIAARTGLRLTPHYGAAHLARRFSREPALASAARRGVLVAGPVAAFVLARIGLAAPPACDPTLAQRTLLYDPWSGAWDAWLCRRFGVPRACLPEVRPGGGPWGSLRIAGREVPVTALAGDQQAAAAAFDLEAGRFAGLVQTGTGAFVLLPAGPGRRGQATPRRRREALSRGLLLSVRADLEGGVFIEGTVNAAGAALDAVAGWIGRAAVARAVARRSPRAGAGEALLVPAFAGLGAPYWDPGARPLLAGADAIGGPEDLALAALRGICHRVTDILEAAAGRGGAAAEAPLILSGPLGALPAFARLLCEIAGRPVRVAREPEATLRGAARLAARHAGLTGIPAVAGGTGLRPGSDAAGRGRARAAWRAAVRAARGSR